MRRTDWLRLFGSFAFGLVAVNFLTVWKAHSQGEELLRHLPQGKFFDTVFLGNSTMEADLNLPLFAQAAHHPQDSYLKLALGGVSAEEECLVLREFFARGNQAKKVVVGFHDLHLEGNAHHTWSTLSGASNVVYFTSDAKSLELYGLPMIEHAKVALTRWVPVLVKRVSLWGRVEMLRRKLGGLGMPPAPATEFGRVADFKFYPFVEKDREEAHELMKQFVQTRAPLSRPLSCLVEECRARGTTLIAIEMPLLKERNDLCLQDARWQAYREFRRTGLSAAGAQYITGFEWLEDASCFRDPVHMSASGAERFSKRLAEVLVQSPLPHAL